MSRKLIYISCGLALIGVVIGAVVGWRWYRSPQRRFDSIVARDWNASEAAKQLTEVVVLDPEFFDAYILRAKAYRQLRQYVACVADCDMAARLDPRRAEPHFIRGGALIEVW
jgi:hypothetical protein